MVQKVSWQSFINISSKLLEEFVVSNLDFWKMVNLRDFQNNRSMTFRLKAHLNDCSKNNFIKFYLNFFKIKKKMPNIKFW